MTNAQTEAGEVQSVGIFAERLLESPLPWTKMRALRARLGLAQKFGAERLDAACARAPDMLSVHRLAPMLEIAAPLSTATTAARVTPLRPLPAARQDVRRTFYQRRTARMTTDAIGPDLMATLRRLKLGKLLDTLPDRLALARQQKIAHQDFLLLPLSDEVSRRDSASTTMRAARAQLDPEMQIERWDPSSKVTYDQALLYELISMRFVEAHAHVALVGPVGVGKTFLAHIACRDGYPVLVLRAYRMPRRCATRASTTATRPSSAS